MYRYLLLTLLLGLPAYSTTIAYSVDVLIPVAVGTDIGAGDRYHLSFNIDFDALDSNALVTDGQFVNAITGTSLAPSAGNTGAWDFSGDVIASTEVNTFDPLGMMLTLNSPDTIGSPENRFFLGLQLDFNLAVNDTGSGQTLEQQVGTPTVGQLLSAAGGGSLLLFDNVVEEPFSVDVKTKPSSATVPEPSSVLLFVTGLAVIAGYSRSRRRRRG
jgi:hypothetical protein